VFRFPSLSLFAVASACALAACGGGASLPGPSGSTAALGRSAAQSARDAQAGPPLTNPYPFAQGDVFNFDYAENISTTTGGQPAVKSSVTGTDVLTINGTESFDGGKWTELTEVLNYTDLNGSGQTTASGTETTDFYRNFVPDGKVLDYLQAGLTTAGQESESNGDTIATSTTYTYASPYLIDIVPETKGSWNEDLANTQSGQTTTTTSAYTEVLNFTFTRNTDLSYTRQLQFAYTPGGDYTETDTLSAKGAAEDQNNFPTKNSTAGTTTWAVPAKVGGKYVIAVVYTPPSGKPTTTDVPDWYPGGGAIKKLVTDTKKDTGTVKVPTQCGKAVAGQTATELVETDSYLDPEQGTYDTETQNTYVVSGEGRVCVVRSYVNDTYDNRVTGDLVTGVTGKSILNLTSESLQQLRAKREVVGFPQGRPG
jgi:hypothetical protein